MKRYLLILSLCTSIFCLTDYFWANSESNEIVTRKILTEHIASLGLHGNVPQYKIVTRTNKYTCSKSTYKRIKIGDTLNIYKTRFLNEVKHIMHKKSSIQNNFNSIYTYNGALIYLMLLCSVYGIVLSRNKIGADITQMISTLVMCYIVLSIIINYINHLYCNQ